MANVKHISEEKCVAINQPFVNILKKYDINCWKKCLSIGTLSSHYDPQIKSTIFKISGSNPSNCIQLPKFAHQHLRLKSRYFYLNFFFDPKKNFSIHVDCKLENDARRISISTSFKDFKISSFGCQIPIVFGMKRNGRMVRKMSKTCTSGQLCIFIGDDAKWTTLCLDLEALCDLIWHKSHSHIKGLKFCGEIGISHMFVSDYLFVPRHLLEEVMAPLCYVLPDEMSFPVSVDQEWKECYAFVCFPQNACMDPDCKHNHQSLEKNPSEVLKQKEAGDDTDDEWMEKSSSSLSKEEEKGEGHDSSVSSQSDPVLQLEHALGFGGANMKHALMDSNAMRVIYPCNALLVLLDVNSGIQKFMIGHTHKISCLAIDNDFQLLASAQSGNPGLVRIWSTETLDCLSVLNPGGLNVICISMSRSGQRLCCLGRDALLKNVMVVWDISYVRVEGEFEALCRGHTEVQIVKMMMMPAFNDSSEDRMISCGHGNIRLWRTKGGCLKSTPINLLDHHTESFVDLSFEAEAEPSEFTERTLESARSVAYACTKSHLLFEIDCIGISILRIIDFKTPSPSAESTMASTLLVTQNYFCVGNESGGLELKTRDGSVDLFKMNFESSIEVLRSSNDCIRILVGQSDGNLGLLDLKKRELETLQSLAGRKIKNCSIDGRTFSMSILSADGRVTVWSLFDMTKPRCASSVPRDKPTASAFHPTLDLLLVGCSSGVVRVFETGDLHHLMTTKLHDATISDVVINKEGTLLYSCSTESGKISLHRIYITKCDGEPSSQGVVYNRNKIDLNHLRSSTGVVITGEASVRSSRALSFSSDGLLLAHVGPNRSLVSVRDSLTLDEVKRIDMKSISKAYDWRAASTCQNVTFSFGSNTCLIIQSGDGCIYFYDYLKDVIIKQFESPGTSGIIPMPPTETLALACDKVIKLCLNGNYSQCQHFIGHSEPIIQILFDPMRSALITIGDTVLTWKFTPTRESPDYLTRSLHFGHQPLSQPSTRYDRSRNKASTFRSPELSASEGDYDDADLACLPTIRRTTNHNSKGRCLKINAGLTADDSLEEIDLSNVKRRYAIIKT